ncbi:MAG: DUF3078 domain-containing protein [candidate division Zixibacteria bacterium]|nr:DUF3078 domain-containing protein [candidate division Zixibacteria bacterium]MDH3936750.1 DUF3078 domain-containing protein [candidate division Zixibacteria bacterium]MDH4033773.1 DUF3078 domain-containing protein [candidate division Zixibacteria bacterium]
MNRIVTTLGTLLLVTVSTLYSADTDTPNRWKRSLIVDATVTQTSYSDSWVGGEAGSVNWVGNLNTSVEKQLKAWLDFRSTLKLSFGQTITQDAETKGWSKPKKSTDLIDWENVGRFTLNKFVDPYAAFRLESQFMDASMQENKLYFSPVRLTESAGIARKFYERDKDFFTSRLGLALRQTLKSVAFYNMDSTEILTADTTLTDGGLESVTDIVLTLSERLHYTGKLTVYKALFFSEKDNVKDTPFEDDWKAIDVNWENIFAASISKIITVNFYTQLLYDKQVSKKGRFKETLGIGFVFKLM